MGNPRLKSEFPWGGWRGRVEDPWGANRPPEGTGPENVPLEGGAGPSFGLLENPASQEDLVTRRTRRGGLQYLEGDPCGNARRERPGGERQLGPWRGTPPPSPFRPRVDALGKCGVVLKDPRSTEHEERPCWGHIDLGPPV